MSDYKNARMIALALLDKELRETSDVTSAVQNAVDKSTTFYSEVNKNELFHDLLTSINIQIGKPDALTNDAEEHIPWLNEAKLDVKWKLWERYRRYLLQEKGWAPQVVQSLDNTTDDILELLEDPRDPTRSFDRKGLVVGYVQSGKTANFTGLINKAIDAGYKLIIVLGGIHNSLRSQTQMRLDEEVLGFETSRQMVGNVNEAGSRRIGVSAMTGEEFVNIGFLTSRDERGDFSRQIARTITVQPGALPFLLVIKKNATVLRNVLNYFRTDSPLATKSPGADYKTVKGIPLLLIDDEADQASVNTGDLVDEDGKLISDYDPTKINALIRELYVTFEQRAYVGYTATPFANIFAHDTAQHEKLGAELFPSSFIINLPKPSTYFGPLEVFGLADESIKGHPVVRIVNDGAVLVRDKHKKDDSPSGIPCSLRNAIYSFLISTAIRRIRGQIKVHNSMLIHVTRFNAVQKKIRALVEDEKDRIRRLIRYGEGNSAIFKEMHELWFTDYKPSSAAMGNEESETWEQIQAELLPVIESIKVKEINGTAGDILDYKEHTDGLNVIAVGGDKLSRGLTLEGLTVSYYLRSSKMYDTLMQMGRWFGYRSGYADLCRIYTTQELMEWFQHIALATEELREELQRMASEQATPAEFGLRVRSHPAMIVTSNLKMKSGTEIKISYDGTISETTVFEKAPQVLDANFSAVDSFIRTLGSPTTGYLESVGRKATDRHYVWPHVSGDSVADFLEQYKTPKSAVRANTKLIAKFIRQQLKQDELIDWTVVMVSLKKPYREEHPPVELVGGHVVNCVNREKTVDEHRTNDRFLCLGRLATPSHELLDFTQDQIAQLRTDSGDGSVSNATARKYRNKKKGLLLIYPLSHVDLEMQQAPIGLAVSFPKSETAEKVSYVVNNVYMENDYDNA